MELKQIKLFISVFCFVAVSFILPVIAAGPSTSSGTVTFSAKGVTPPVDPENPTEPQAPPEVPGTGQEGNLTLDVVPHPYFGEYPVPTINTMYKSKIVAGIGNAEGNALAQTFVQVSDARSGSYTGWNVSVKADIFINPTDPDNHINGAKIIFSTGNVRGPSGLNKPDAYAVSLNCINDATQNEEKIFIAASGNGVGTWVNCLYPTPWLSPPIGADNDLIRLFIPANSGAIENNTYYSNLTWTLSDAP